MATMNELNSIYTCLASGDPLTDSVVLMSRLEAEKWLGGHNSNPVTSSSITVPVNWEIATDPMFNQIVNRGVANASVPGFRKVVTPLISTPGGLMT